jgi:hypothetical protein
MIGWNVRIRACGRIGNATDRSFREEKMYSKYYLPIVIFLLGSTIAVAQGNFTPRDADEREAWQIYNQYKASRKLEGELAPRIAQLQSDIRNASQSTIGALGAHPEDVAERNAKQAQLKTEQKRQTDLLAKWRNKFYGRYGDLRWSDEKIYDAKAKRDMDRIEFALVYFPFKYVPEKPAVATVKPPPETVPASSAPADSTSLTLELPGYWGHLSYTIAGARLEKPTGSDRGNVGGRQYKGELTGKTLTVSGTAVSDNPSSGPGSMDYYELVVSVKAGKEQKEYGYIAPKGEKLNKSFSLSIPVPPGSSGSFSISLLEQNANYGPHGWVVTGSLSAPKPGSTPPGKAVPAGGGNTAGQGALPPIDPADARSLFKSGNDYGVLNGGKPVSFIAKQAFVITQIVSYHWNNGQGAPGGTIALQDSAGKIFGPWPVTVRNGVYWEVNREIRLPAGTYTVIDSDPSTWAQNSQSGGKGMVEIRGVVP